MTTLPTRSFATIVSNIAAGIQGRVSSFLNFGLGSVFRAVSEAVAGNSLWLQAMILQLVKLTRLSTSFGPDADSWVADWAIIKRLGAQAATGLVVFSRYTASGAKPVILVGARVQTLDGKQVFAVAVDTANAAYSVTAGGYVMPAQVSSLIVPVVSITPSATNASGMPGTNGNVTAGAISRLGTSIPGIDTVINPAGFTNGIDEESDPAFKLRFQLAIQALSRGTVVAIRSAIAALGEQMQVQVRDGEAIDGTVTPGYVSVIVDDGSGSIPGALLASCQAAANAVRAAGVRMGVFAGQKTLATVALTLSLLPGYSRQQVAAQVAATVAGNINEGGLGAGLAYFTVGSWAVSVPGVARIDGLLLNGGTSDIPGDPRYTIKSAGVTVS